MAALLRERAPAAVFFFERFADIVRFPLREAAAFLAPLRMGALFTFLPLPLPERFPPPLILFTVAHARFSASSSLTPRAS